MTGPLNHFMPVIAANRHRVITGDPYIDYVSFMTEFRGRPVGYTGPGLDNMNIPRDLANNTPLFIAGTPNRFPLENPAADTPVPAPMGISDFAAYRADLNGGFGSGITVMDTSHLQFGENDFEIRIRAASNQIRDQYLCGRWVSGGNCWAIQYYYAMKQLRFIFTTTGSTVEFNEYPIFRMGTTNDGLTQAEFFDGNFHDIVVTRSGTALSISVDGLPGYKMGNMTYTTLPSIYDGPGGGSTPPFCIGAIPATLNTIRVGNGNWRGLIKKCEIDVGGGPALNVNFDAFGDHEYWSMWWVGHYPQTKWPSALNLEGTNPHEFQTDQGLIKETNYIGNYWPYDDELNLLGEDFTLEVFNAKFTFIQNKIQTIIGMGWPGVKAWRFIVQNQGTTGTPGQLAFQYSLDSTTVVTIPLISDMVPNSTYNVSFSISRVGSDLRAYLNGLRVFQGTISGSLSDCAGSAVRMGFYADNNNSSTANSDMQVLGFRMTKGIGRYRSRSYRVPTLPLPKYSS